MNLFVFLSIKKRYFLEKLLNSKSICSLRKINLEARKYISNAELGPFDSSADLLKEPLMVAKATGTNIVKKEKQRV